MDERVEVFVEHFDAVSALWTRAKSSATQSQPASGNTFTSTLEEWGAWSENLVRAARESSVDPSSLENSSDEDLIALGTDWNAYVDRKLDELTQSEGVGEIGDRDLDALLRVWEAEALVRSGMVPSRAWEFAGFLPSLKDARGKITQGVIGPLGLVLASAIGSVRQWMDAREVQTWQALVRVLGASRVIAAAGVLVEADSLAAERWDHPIAGLSQIMGELKAASEAAGLNAIE